MQIMQTVHDGHGEHVAKKVRRDWVKVKWDVITDKNGEPLPAGMCGTVTLYLQIKSALLDHPALVTA